MLPEQEIKQLVDHMAAKKFLLGDMVVVITGNYATPVVIAPSRARSLEELLTNLRVEVRPLDPDITTAQWIKYGALAEIKNVDTN